MSIKNVVQMLGHTDTSVTKHYTQVLNQNIFKDMQRVNSCLSEFGYITKVVANIEKGLGRMNFIFLIPFFYCKFFKIQYEALTKLNSEKQYFQGWKCGKHLPFE
jgi:hypothetical protein